MVTVFSMNLLAIVCSGLWYIRLHPVGDILIFNTRPHSSYSTVLPIPTRIFVPLPITFGANHVFNCTTAILLNRIRDFGSVSSGMASTGLVVAIH